MLSLVSQEKLAAGGRMTMSIKGTGANKLMDPRNKIRCEDLHVLPEQ